MCELQALSRRNLNILLAEYPDVGDELKTVAKNRASFAKKGKVEDDAEDFSRAETTPSPAKESVHVPLKLIATPPHSVNRNDAKYLSLVEKELERIINTLSLKIRSDMGITDKQHTIT